MSEPRAFLPVEAHYPRVLKNQVSHLVASWETKTDQFPVGAPKPEQLVCALMEKLMIGDSRGPGFWL